MGIKVIRDAKARPYLAVVNGRLQRVRPKERYWLLAEQAESHRDGLPVRSSARAISSQAAGNAPADDEPPSGSRRNYVVLGQSPCGAMQHPAP
jgi:hypothetical protein